MTEPDRSHAYGEWRGHAKGENVLMLTPRSTVETIRASDIHEIHPSAAGMG